VVKVEKHKYKDVIVSAQDEEDWLQPYERALEGHEGAGVTFEDDVFWYIGRLWLPDSVDLRKIILQEEYHSEVGGHMGQEKTNELGRRSFFWPQMDR